MKVSMQRHYCNLKTEPETFSRVFAPGKQTCAATYRIISLAWPYSKYTARRAFMHTKLFSALIITISADKLSIYPLFTALRNKILIHPVLNMMLRIFQFWLKLYYFNMIVFNDSVMFHLEIHWHYITAISDIYLTRFAKHIAVFKLQIIRNI